MIPRGCATRQDWIAGFVQLAILIVALCLATMPLPSELIEKSYSQGFYPVVRRVVTGWSSQINLVLFDWLLVGGVGGTVGWWALSLVRAVRLKRLRMFMRPAWRTLVIMAVVYIVFLTTWGLNYRRQSLGTRLGYLENRVTVAQLEKLATVAVGRVNGLHDATEGESWPQLSDLPDRLGAAFVRIQRSLGVLEPTDGLMPRRSILTPYFRRAGIDGMVDPFFLQVLVNDTVLPFERPFVAAHEWAHVAGYAHEAEANFVAWLSCLEGDTAMQYSGWFYLVGRLLRVLPGSSQAVFASRLGPGPRADYASIRERFNRTVPIVQRNASRINDRYLRANQVASGVASYGEVIQLVVGTDVGRQRWLSLE
ncbi:MAG: hypothetical protein CL484_09750 [Acidobacteria bacterium]|nr:hypothetical protein [Acidobacteriota bacterium]